MVKPESIIRYVPDRWQIVLKQLIYAWKIKTGRFVTNEPEFDYIKSIVHAGDNVIDIGANMGVYTLKFSQLVGKTGHVYAFEPIPESFYLLTAHINLCQHKNVTLLNMAASDKVIIAPMTIPHGNNRLRNYYRASLVASGAEVGQDVVRVLCCPLDVLHLPQRIRLVKIDVEGHEAAVLDGMKGLIERDKPVLIVESIPSAISEWLSSQGYKRTELPDSPNTIFESTSV